MYLPIIVKAIIIAVIMLSKYYKEFASFHLPVSIGLILQAVCCCHGPSRGNNGRSTNGTYLRVSLAHPKRAIHGYLPRYVIRFD